MMNKKFLKIYILQCNIVLLLQFSCLSLPPISVAYVTDRNVTMGIFIVGLNMYLIYTDFSQHLNSWCSLDDSVALIVQIIIYET